jgi:predicted ATPase
MLEYIHIRNFKCRNIKLGTEKKPLTSRVAITGRIDAPLDAIFAAFRFLKTAINYNIAYAVSQQGGFQKIALNPAPISFQLQYRTQDVHLRYELVIGPPFNVQSETLISLKDQTKLDFASSVNDQVLGVAVLGALKNSVQAASLLKFIEAWDLIDFAPSPALNTRIASTNTRLNIDGSNLTRALYVIKTYEPAKFKEINDKLWRETGLTVNFAEGDLLVLHFAKDNVVGDHDTIPVLKILAYFVLAANPAPLIFAQYPENFLPYKADSTLMLDLFATNSQVFSTTHSFTVLNLMQPNEIFVVPSYLIDAPNFPRWE